MSFQIGELFNLDYWRQMFSGDLFSQNFFGEHTRCIGCLVFSL